MSSLLDDAARRAKRCLGGTVCKGRTAMRISVSSWATTEADVELCLKSMLRAADAVTR
jgi:hypothetical protein